MPSPRIRADYQQLALNATKFGRQADLARQMLQNVHKQQAVLQGGDWIGVGANQSFSEMNSQLLPTLNRLVLALEAANRTTMSSRAAVGRGWRTIAKPAPLACSRCGAATPRRWWTG